MYDFIQTLSLRTNAMSEAIQTPHIYPITPKGLDYFVALLLVMTENEYIQVGIDY